MRSIGGPQSRTILVLYRANEKRPRRLGPLTHGFGMLAHSLFGGNEMSDSDLERVAAAMVGKGKGILAADESNATCTKRFDKLGIPSTEEHRRAYRELLFTTPDAAQWISGVILYLSLIHISEPTRQAEISYAVF